jgi:hypothetical protein
VRVLLQVNLFLLFLVAVFDPADKVTQLKVPLFISLWVLFLFSVLFANGKRSALTSSLLRYVLLFSVILPTASVLWYFVRGGGVGLYDGLPYIKSFLFLTLAIVLVVTQLDAIRPLSVVLTILSAVITCIAVLCYNDPSLAQFLWPIGGATGVFAIGDRTYGSLSYTYIYFHSAPLLILSIAYFANQTIKSTGTVRYVNAALMVLNLVGMVCSGTRNDMIFGLLTPILVMIWGSGRHRKLTLAAVIVVLTVAVGVYGNDILQAMFDPENESNAVKIAHLKDYAVLFSDPLTLLFGQGLGAYFYSTAFGTETSITELTYLEFIRNFGLFLAIVYFCLLSYPLLKLRDSGFRADHYLLIAYASYLIMSASNPLLISSNGMLVLAIVISKTFSPFATRKLEVAELRLSQQPA